MVFSWYIFWGLTGVVLSGVIYVAAPYTKDVRDTTICTPPDSAIYIYRELGIQKDATPLGTY